MIYSDLFVVFYIFGILKLNMLEMLYCDTRNTFFYNKLENKPCASNC